MNGGPPRVARLRRMLFEAWGATDDPVIVSRAPGRVNLIGEHTDYNEGLVLPAAIDLDVSIAFRPRLDRRVELHSLAFGETRAFDLDDIKRAGVGGGVSATWIDYVAGTAWALAGAGFKLRGLQGIVESRLPPGAGLASSAALELASALALIDPEKGPMPEPLHLAALARRGEEQFVGVRCGVMDQIAAAAGRPGHALMIDCRSLEVEPIPLPDGISLVVCDSGVPRRLAESRYNERRAECDEGVRLLRERLPLVSSLRDVDPETFGQQRTALPEVIAMRCEHVIRETQRVRETVQALRSRDLAAVGVLFAESHASLRDLYQVSSPELDALVDIASGLRGMVGARMTGAGFGGCTVNLVQTDAVDEFREAILRGYAERTSRTGGGSHGTRPTLTVRVVEAVDGAGLL